MASELWLLRHGDAVAHGSRGRDDDRELTQRGAAQSRSAGAALRALGIDFGAVYTSPKLRAEQTARLVCEAMGVAAPTVYEPLREGFTASEALALARGVDGERLLVVGHNPDMAEIVYDVSGARVAFKKGGVAAVALGGQQLLALLRPRELLVLAASGDAARGTGAASAI
jgi:phosphohistidine phosphatase